MAGKQKHPAEAGWRLGSFLTANRPPINSARIGMEWLILRYLGLPISSALFKGFFWKDVPVAQFLRGDFRFLYWSQIAKLRRSIAPFMTELSPHGWYRGIPNRTLFLSQNGLRLVYGGSMGDEIGLRSLDGKTTIGFFRSESLVALLKSFE